jgi:hypothetical protein
MEAKVGSRLGWLERYKQVFVENEIDVGVLPRLTADDLRDKASSTRSRKRCATTRRWRLSTGRHRERLKSAAA